MFNQYFCVINQFFCMMNQKMVHHTENFWGSGFYRETVRPNCFLCTNALTTNLTFCLEFSPILMSNMNWHLILWYPGWRQFLFILFPHLKCWPHVFHLCANCIPPETIAILFVNCNRLFHWFWNMNSKLMRSLPVLTFNFGWDPIVLPHHISNPPDESRFLI